MGARNSSPQAPGPAKVSKPGENEANRRWGSLRRRKGSSQDTGSGGTLPRHLERGKNLSKRFRKSCRNWAASKGLIGPKPCSDVVNNEATVDAPGDIVVIDLDEEPEIHYKRTSEDSDIGRLVADLVLDAKRRNTLPRSGSKQSVGKESLDVPLTALENSTAVNEAAEAETTAEITSPGDLLDKSLDDSEAEIVELKEEKKGSGKVLETSFDEHDPSEVSTNDDLDEESLATKASENTEDSGEIFESIGETLFYNGITLNKEFAVRASYSGELFKEETTTSSETSQLDQAGFTEISTFNISTEECLDENIKENENNDDEKANLNEDLCLKDVVTEGESLEFIKTKDELVEKEWLFNGDMIGLEEGKVCSTKTDNMSLSEEEVNETCGENQEDNLHRNGCLSFESSEHDFNSIAKISALDFLNEDESEEEEDEEEDDLEEDDFYRRYFASSQMLAHHHHHHHHMFTKDTSFPSLSVTQDDEDEESEGSEATCGSYLEAINPELDKTDQNIAVFGLSSAEFRINPFYKDEDSLSNSLVLNADSQNQTFNYNFQQFFDLWEIFSQESKDDKQAASVPENSPTMGLCNLEAIQEEDEMDEDFERDENNNYDDDDDDDDESEENSEPEEENMDPAVMQQTSLSCLDGENVELIEREGEKNVTVDNSEKSGTVAVKSGDNVENEPGTADTDDMDDYKLYEGLSVLFQSEPYHSNSAPNIEKENDFNQVNITTNDLIDLGPEESVEDYIENFLESLILNIVSLKELSGSDYLDMDDEYYSCDSPIEDENDRTDLHSEFGSDRGISTDEGIDATTDEDDEYEDEMNKVKEKIELERDSALVSTKF